MSNADIYKELLLTRYFQFKEGFSYDSEIDFREFIKPNRSDKKTDKLRMEGKASSLNNLPKDQKDLFENMIGSVRHRRPNDSSILETSLRVESVDKLLRYCESKEFKPVLFKGLKGSGKTTALNIFTYLCNENYENSKTLVIRGNAEEYHELKQLTLKYDPNGDNYMFSVNAYMMLRMSLLLCVHMEDSTPFLKIYESIHFKSVDRKFNKNGGDRNQVYDDLISKIATEIELSIGDGHGKAYGMEISKIFRNRMEPWARGAKAKADKSWYELAQGIKEYCKENGVRLMYVFDGVDNVYTFTKQEENAYELMIDDLVAYSRDFRGNDTYISYLIACRPETFIKIRRRLVSGMPQCPVEPIEHTDENEFNKIIEKKVNLLGDVIKSHVTQNPSLSELVSFHEYKKFAHQLASECGLKTHLELYSNNARSFLYNYIMYCVAKAHFINMNPGLDSLPTPTKYSLFLKNLFSGGRLLVESIDELHSGQSKYPLVYPNPFNYRFPTSEKLRVVKDHLLAAIAILQEFQGKNPPLDLEETTERLASKYGYNDEVIGYLFKVLVQFRMLEQEHLSEPSYECYRISTASKVLTRVITSKPDVMFWLMFDCSMSQQTWSQISSDTPSFEMTKYYQSTLIRLIPRFLAYLNIAAKQLHGNELVDAELVLANLASFVESSISAGNMTQFSAEEYIDSI